MSCLFFTTVHHSNTNPTSCLSDAAIIKFSTLCILRNSLPLKHTRIARCPKLYSSGHTKGYCISIVHVERLATHRRNSIATIAFKKYILRHRQPPLHPIVHLSVPLADRKTKLLYSLLVEDHLNPIVCCSAKQLA